MTKPARSTWMGGLALSPEQHRALLGPGGPFEMVVEPVLGHDVPVFARRSSNLRSMFDQLSSDRADWPFLVDTVAGDAWTFGDTIGRIDAVADVLVEQYGIGRGDRVGIVAANAREYAVLMWATVSIGAIVVSLNGWWVGAELAYGIELSRPKLVVGDEPRLARIPDGAVPDGVPVVVLGELVGGAGASAPPRPAADVDEDDPAVILFTSGTTGRSKGAMLSHRNIINMGFASGLSRAIAAVVNGEPADAPVVQPASILSSPMFHISGMIAVFMTGPVFGTKLVFAPPRRWDARAHLELSVEHGVSAWSGVPTQYWRMLRDPDFDSFDLRSVRAATSGGAPFPPELVHEFERRMPWAMPSNGYGMSETCGAGTVIGGPMMRALPDSVGPPYAGFEVEIRDPEDNVVAEGEVGEIHLRGASVFLGYWDNQAATDAVFDSHRWYRTGDFGRIVDGFLYLESRMRDLIIRGGENIYPIEIENRLVEHPDIDDAAVIGVDHPELGQEVKAFVVRRPGAEVAAEEVRAWVAEGLAAFKVPAHVAFVDALPYTESGKVIKHELERNAG